MTTTAAPVTAHDVTSAPRRSVEVRPARGRHCPAAIRVTVRGTEYNFELLADNVWRLTSKSTYGNLTLAVKSTDLAHGAAARRDASGVVVQGHLAAALASFFAA